MNIGKKLLNSSASSIIIFLAVLVSINFMANQRYWYLDLTQDKIYTISPATKDILKNLNKSVNVTFYISKDLPADLANVRTQLRDLASQYQALGGNNLKISYVEPEDTQEKVIELAQKGIPQLQFNVIEKDKYEVRKGFFGAEITSGEGTTLKSETIPIIQSLDNLEYDFVSSVYSVSRDKKEMLGILLGHGEKEFKVPDIEKSYDIANVKISTDEAKKGLYEDATSADGKEVSKNFITPMTLIIDGPSAKLTPEEIIVLDEYIKNGGNIVVLSEGVEVDLNNNLSAKPLDNGLNDLLKKYGLQINTDLVYDKSNSNITYRQGIFSVSQPYAFWVKAVSDNFQGSSALSRVQEVVFPWTSSLAISESTDYDAKPLVTSTSSAGTMTGEYNLLPDAALNFSQGSKKTIVAMSEPKDKNAKHGTLIVAGNSGFAGSNFMDQIKDNRTFFINLVDSVSNTANLSSIRSKNIASRPLKDLEENDKNFWKFAAIFGAAGIIDIYGFFRIMKRKKANK